MEGKIFTGEWWEAYTELLFLRARYYEPGTGRFVSRDPWGGDYSQPPTLLRSYLYVLNNPVNAVDPSGWYRHKEMHYGKTRQWAFEIASAFAGLLKPEPIAEAIAVADRGTDTDPYLTSVWSCNVCHFCSYERTISHIDKALASCNPYFFGFVLHQLQDFYSHRNEGYEWEHLSDTVNGRPQHILDDFFEGGCVFR